MVLKRVLLHLLKCRVDHGANQATEYEAQGKPGCEGQEGISFDEFCQHVGWTNDYLRSHLKLIRILSEK